MYNSKISWTEDSLEELLHTSIGDLREMLAHEDADIEFRTFLIENGWLEDIDDDYNDSDYEDEEDEDEEDIPSDELSLEEEDLAINIARDIRCGNYSFDTINGLYNGNILNRIRQLIQ